MKEWSSWDFPLSTEQYTERYLRACHRDRIHNNAACPSYQWEHCYLSTLVAMRRLGIQYVQQMIGNESLYAQQQQVPGLSESAEYCTVSGGYAWDWPLSKRDVNTREFDTECELVGESEQRLRNAQLLVHESMGALKSVREEERKILWEFASSQALVQDIDDVHHWIPPSRGSVATLASAPPQARESHCTTTSTQTSSSSSPLLSHFGALGDPLSLLSLQARESHCTTTSTQTSSSSSPLLSHFGAPADLLSPHRAGSSRSRCGSHCTLMSTQTPMTQCPPSDADASFSSDSSSYSYRDRNIARFRRTNASLKQRRGNAKEQEMASPAAQKMGWCMMCVVVFVCGWSAITFGLFVFTALFDLPPPIPNPGF